MPISDPDDEIRNTKMSPFYLFFKLVTEIVFPCQRSIVLSFSKQKFCYSDKIFTFVVLLTKIQDTNVWNRRPFYHFAISSISDMCSILRLVWN